MVYLAMKAAVLAISDGLRQELAGHIGVSTVLPDFGDTVLSEHVKSPALKQQLQQAGEKLTMSPEVVARVVGYILEQPEGVNIGR